MPFDPIPGRKAAPLPLHAGAAMNSEGVFMRNRFIERQSATAGFAIVVPFAALVWLFAVPQSISTVTFVAVALLAMGAAVVAVNTWRNGQATRHIGHVLNDAEAAAAAALAPLASDADATAASKT